MVFKVLLLWKVSLEEVWFKKTKAILDKQILSKLCIYFYNIMILVATFQKKERKMFKISYFTDVIE